MGSVTLSPVSMLFSAAAYTSCVLSPSSAVALGGAPFWIDVMKSANCPPNQVVGPCSFSNGIASFASPPFETSITHLPSSRRGSCMHPSGPITSNPLNPA